MTPFVGDNFNLTRAGIHADGILKNEEIYNIFNTDLLLKRPVKIAVGKTSGLAGIAHWINSYFKYEGDKKIGKQHPVVVKIKEWVDKQYEEGRVTQISDMELAKLANTEMENYINESNNN